MCVSPPGRHHPSIHNNEPESRANMDMEPSFCADCAAVGVETAMADDHGSGSLCPVHDAHDDCTDYPCSGDDDGPCVLRQPR